MLGHDWHVHPLSLGQFRPIFTASFGRISEQQLELFSRSWQRLDLNTLQEEIQVDPRLY
jgi:hypothetical protein